FSHFFTAVTLTHFMPFGVGAGVVLAFVPLPCPLCPPLQLNSRLMSAASPSTVIALACALITIVHLHYLMGWAAKKACLAAIRISQRGVSLPNVARGESGHARLKALRSILTNRNVVNWFSLSSLHFRDFSWQLPARPDHLTDLRRRAYKHS